jgi:hypothetical protein
MNAPMQRSTAALVALLGCLLPAASARAEPNVVDQVIARCGERPHTYDQMMAWLTRLDGSDRVSVIPIGRTPGGRTIPLVALYYPGTTFGRTVRLFIVARQHGTEVAGTEAVMAIINHLVQSNAPSDLALLQRLTFAIVPMANPDGVAETGRCNSAGVDLNRDWNPPSQPETRAIDWALRVWQPNGFIDCHELPAESSKEAYQENFLETIAEDPQLNRDLTRWCSTISLNVRSYEEAYGCRLNVYYDDHSTDRSLSHRQVGLGYQVPSFLLESKTGRGRSLQDRVRFHVVGILVTANILAQQAAPPPPPSVRTPVQPSIMNIPFVPPAPAPRRPSAPAQTVVSFTSPKTDGQTFSDKIPLRVEVQASPEFSYVSMRVNGVLRSLSDSVPYEHGLSLEGFSNGSHTLTCQAHDGGGRVLAEATRLVRVDKNAAGR